MLPQVVVMLINGADLGTCALQPEKSLHMATFWHASLSHAFQFEVQVLNLPTFNR